MITKVVCVQCFVKYDTLEALLRHLSLCHDKENYIVVFGIDSHIDMPYLNRKNWINNNNKVLELISQYVSQNIHKYTIVLKNEHNLGAYKTCYNLINYSMEISDYVIFIEDDIILAKDALIFYHQAFLFNQQDPRLFAISSKSITEKNSQSQKHLFTLQKCNWISSAEFGISKTIWQTYGSIRGQKPHGDAAFGFACRNNNMYTIYPTVDRSCRIGFHHPDSFSGYYNNNIQMKQNLYCKPNSDQFLISDIDNLYLNNTFNFNNI